MGQAHERVRPPLLEGETDTCVRQPYYSTSPSYSLMFVVGMDIVLQYSPLVDAEEGTPTEEGVSLSAQGRDVLRRLPAAAAAGTPLNLKDLRHAAVHAALRPHLFGHLTDEQLLEVVTFLDFWELPLPWLQMAQAERGARLRPTRLQERTDVTPPLNAYSDAAGTWALAAEIEPLLLSVAHAMSSKSEPRLWWSTLQQPPRSAVTRALHILCGERQPELVSTDDTVLSHVLASAGDVEALQWAREHGCPWDYRTCSRAAQKGRLEVLQWLHAHGCPWDEQTCSSAAGGGHLFVLQWAREHGCPWYEKTCSSAAEGGHLFVLQWARENGAPWGAMTCSSAAARGHLEVLRWAREHGCCWDASTCASAAQGGHLEVLQWAQEHGAPWDEQTSSSAAEGGHLFVLQWARENGAPWGAMTCSSAAVRGHLEVLRWAREHGCPWDSSTCYYAAHGGHLEVLQWARQQGCPWVKEGILRAAGAHRTVMQWLSSEASDA